MNSVREVVTFCQKLLASVEFSMETIERLTKIFQQHGWAVDGGMYKRVFIKGKLVVKVGDLNHDIRLYRNLRKAGWAKVCPRIYFISPKLMVQQRVQYMGNLTGEQYDTIQAAIREVEEKGAVHITDVTAPYNIGVLNGVPKIVDGLCLPKSESGYFGSVITRERYDNPRMGGRYEGRTRNPIKPGKKWAESRSRE